jgi:hypothetical protein
LKGGNSRWQRKKKQQRKNQRRERGTKARRLITAPESLRGAIPNLNPGGEFNFPPGFFAFALFGSRRSLAEATRARRTLMPHPRVRFAALLCARAAAAAAQAKDPTFVEIHLASPRRDSIYLSS